jgi:Lon protease-like protein
MSPLPMFPLGSVLFPHMPLSLRIFEERYVVMLSRVLQEDVSEFGVVLIERGQEVGGGEHRFGIGTVARIVQLEASEGFIGLVAEGDRRIRVDEWLDDAPHPQAEVSDLEPLVWDDDLLTALVLAEDTVRRTLAQIGEETGWSPDVALTEEPVARAWQLAGIAPLGPLDQVELLRAGTMAELLDGIVTKTEAVGDILL